MLPYRKKSIPLREYSFVKKYRLEYTNSMLILA